MKSRLIIFGITILSFTKCQSQPGNRLDERNYLLELPKIKNEFDLLCKEYKGKQDTKLILRICYSDSAMTKPASKHVVKDGTYDGPCIYFTPEGIVTVEGEYKANVKNGNWKYYFSGKFLPQGITKMVRKMVFGLNTIPQEK